MRPTPATDLPRLEGDLDVELAHLGLEVRVGDQLQHCALNVRRLADIVDEVSSISIPVICRSKSNLDSRSIRANASKQRRNSCSGTDVRSSRVNTLCSTSRPIGSHLRCRYR